MQNIVLICLDSVRKDIYEKEMIRTRELVDFSFDDCRATSSWSVPSHASFLTGQLPHEHGVHSHAIDFSLLSGANVLTSRRQFAKTGSISANQFTSTEFGFDRWFDQCLTTGSTSYYPEGLDVRTTEGIVGHFRQSLSHEHPLKSLANGAVSALIETSDGLPIRNPFDNGASTIQRIAEQSIVESSEPYFFFINFMEAHHPHRLIRRYNSNIDVPKRWSSAGLDLMKLNEDGPDALSSHEDYVRKFRRLYRAAVDYLDRRVFKFIRNIQQHSEGEVTIIITADHGENLGYEADDYLFGHTASLSEGVLHVPLDIINPPSQVRIEEDRTFSQRHLRDMVESIARRESPVVPEERYVPGELVGGGLLQDPEKYWDRMIRCVYDTVTNEKIVWDSLGNKYREVLSDGTDSDRIERGSIDTVPEWATKQFGMDISEYKRQVKADDEATVESLDSETKDRLEKLGYL